VPVRRLSLQRTDNRQQQGRDKTWIVPLASSTVPGSCYAINEVILSSRNRHSNQSLCMTERPEFNQYFLENRLKRVPMSVLRSFLLELIEPELKNEIQKDSQSKLIERIFFYYHLRQEKQDFIGAFNQFIRDHLFSAKESVYLIQVPNQDAVIDWIGSWHDGKYIGHRFHFSKHTHIPLKERFLSIEDKKVSFPSDVILLVASSQTLKVIPSGLNLVEYYPTVEIELIFRKGMNLMEARGELAVIRDFINTAVIDSHNPLSMASSFFVGEKEDARANSIVGSIGKVIRIDALKTALNGKYLSISAPVKGEKTSRIQASFEELSDLDDETDPYIKPLLTSLIKDQDHSRISFKYKEQKFSFGITKRGGLTFRQYAPEEVVTYVVSKINSL